MYSHLFLMPGFTSTILSELATTRIATSPAPASFFLRKLLTLVSIYVPSFVTGNRFALNLFSFLFVPLFFKQLSHTNLQSSNYNQIKRAKIITAQIIYVLIQINIWKSMTTYFAFLNSPLRPDGLHVKDTDLMKFPSTILTLHKWFQF